MIRPALLSRFLLAGAIAATFLSPNVHAQAFSSGSDKPVPRMCTNSCVQSNEQLFVDGSGNAIAVWNEPYTDQFGDTYTSLVASRYTAASNAWSSPKRLSENIGYDSKSHAVMNPSGGLKVVRVENHPYYGYGSYRINVHEFSPTTGWRTYSVAGADYYTANNVTIGSGRNGDIFITYDAYTFNRFSQTTTPTEMRFSAARNTWSQHTNGIENYIRPLQIIGDGMGGAFSFASVGGTLSAAQFDSATQKWSDYRTLETLGGNTVTQLHAKSDAAGNVMVIYEVFNSATNTRQLKSRRYQRSTRTWSGKSIPSISGSKLYGAPSIASDRFNNFYATWVQYSGAYTKTISARYSNSGAVWSKPVVVSRGNYHVRDAAVTTDYAGNAIYTWGQRTDTGTGSSTGKIFRTTAVRYSNWTWGTPIVIQDANRIGYKPFIGADNSGRAIVMWTQDSSITGIKEIRSDRLTPK